MNNKQYLVKLQETMTLKGNSSKSIYIYTQTVKQFFRFHKKPAHEITTQDVKDYLLHLVNRGLDPSTINSKHSMLLIFFQGAMEKPEIMFPIPYLKRKKKLPTILTKEEVWRIIEHATTLKYKTIFMVVYSSGLRLNEVANLRISDIDSKRMQIFVHQGKGGKDRYTILSRKALESLRKYYRTYRPDDWLFYPKSNKNKHLSTRAIQDNFVLSRGTAGIAKKCTMHSLRHAFASHLLENETDLFSIMRLLGHCSLRTTQVYLHLSPTQIHKVISPLDLEV